MVKKILLSILVGAVGLMLAWPLAAVVVLGVKMLYVEDVLGDELPTPDDDWRTAEVREAKRQAKKAKSVSPGKREGIIAGSVAAVGAAVAGLLFWRKRKGGEEPAES